MKEALLTVLRNRDTAMENFRQAAEKLATLLAIESHAFFHKTRISLNTPLMPSSGACYNQEFTLVPILRSGLTLLPSFMKFYSNTKIGFIGMCRDEITAIASLYYIKLPVIKRDTAILLLDPMIATGGSAALAVNELKKAGALENQITLVSFIASQQGISHFKEKCPEVNLIVAQVDEGLDKEHRIIPGLGDFGDRYFGTV